MEVDTLTAMKDVAVSGHALTILPVLAIREEQDTGVLKGVRIEKPAIKRTISLGFTRQRPLSKAARFVGKRLRELLRELLRGSLRSDRIDSTWRATGSRFFARGPGWVCVTCSA